MKIGIIGWGVEGQSAYRYFGPEHTYLIVNEEPRDDFPAQSPNVTVRYLDQPRTPGVTGNVQDLSYLDGIEACDKVIYSVTNAKNLERKFGNDNAFWSKAVTTQHIFFETVQTKNIIGVTGTKGKGTTSTLIYQILKAAGKTVFFGGNVGIPVLDFVRDIGPDDWVVLELSSFQLYRFPYSPHIGICLMMAPEHLDWHHDVQDYYDAKANLFRHQSSDDIAIYFSQNDVSKQIASAGRGRKLPYYSPPGAYVDGNDIVIDGSTVCATSELKLLGKHNWQNACAAITAVWQVTQDVEAAREVLTSFAGLEHHTELVREINGVQYYDDSFGTTPDTAIVAIQAFAQPKVVILGGSDKGATFDELAKAVASGNVRHAITIGVTGPKIAAALERAGYTSVVSGDTTMPAIVQQAANLAQPGDVVLLSTGCASFGMFKNYKDRGDQFKAAVRELA